MNKQNFSELIFSAELDFIRNITNLMSPRERFLSLFDNCFYLNMLGDNVDLICE
jgi:hypothetical protein